MSEPECMVVALYDPLEPSLPRWIEAHCEGRPAWPTVWKYRDRVPHPLAVWFRALDAAGRTPEERVVLAGIGRLAAKRLAVFLVAETCRMAGCAPGDAPDFLCNTLPLNLGRGGRRVIVIDPSGNVESYPSISAWSRSDGVNRTSRWPGVVPRGRVGL